MSTPERSQPFAAPPEAPAEQPQSELLEAATPDRQSDPPESEAIRTSPRSSIRPAPADYRPRSDRPAPSPMVVVYSGDSDRPPPCWDVDEPSERPTIAHFAPVPREPFPLAEDLQAPESVSESARPSAPPPAPNDASGTPTLRLSTWPSPPPDEQTRTLRTERAPTRRRRPWLGVALAALGVAGLGLASLGAPPTASDGVPQVAEAPRVAEEAPRVAEEVPRVAAVSPPARVAESAERSDPTPTSATPDDAAEEAAEEAPEEAPPPLAREAGKFQSVTLEIFPADAKVVRKGMRYPGPPYTFKIPAGGRIAIEVAKKGFVTRKVVLDGSESTVSVGLRRAASSRRRNDAAPAPRSAAVHDVSSSRVGSGL